MQAPTCAGHQGGTIGDIILAALERFPERCAFIDGERRISYAELGRHIGSAIALLKALGLKRGDAVVQLSGNRPEVFMTMAACYLMGLRSVTLHAMGSLPDHRYIVDDSDAVLFIADTPYLQRAAELHAECAGVSFWFSHDDGALPAGFKPFWSTALPLPGAPLQNESDTADVIRLAYTGGTTGKPKGVMLANRSVSMQATLMLAARDFPPDTRFLCPTPISHGAGALLVPCLWRGGTIILQRGFDPARFLAALQTHRATMTFLVPTMIYGLLDHLKTQPAQASSLQALMYGAAPMSPSRLREAMATFGPILSQSYGQSECPSNILLLTQADHARTDIDVLSAAGKPYPSLTVKLLDDDDEPVAHGQVGEICVRGALVMEGYWKQPELTASTMKNGWLHTGDMARQDAHGYFHLVDRKKDMIISGGFNVFPKEIEDALTSHPAVGAAAVIGVPDEKWGEAVKAIVVLRAGHQASASELIAHVKEGKGAAQAPKSIDFTDAIALTPLGKADKKALRQHYWLGQARAVN